MNRNQLREDVGAVMKEHGLHVKVFVWTENLEKGEMGLAVRAGGFLEEEEEGDEEA